MIAKLPLVPFEIINLTRLTVGVCMKVRFKSKVTRGFSLSHRFATRLRRFAAISRLKKNLWDQGTYDDSLLPNTQFTWTSSIVCFSLSSKVVF